HTAGGIALHGMDSTVGRTGTNAYHGQRLLAQSLDPLRRLDRLTSGSVGAQGSPIAFLAVNLLVRNRPLNHEHEGIQFAFLSQIEGFEEVVTAFVGEDRIMQMYFRKARNRS